MEKIATVAVDVAVDRTFDYAVPGDLCDVVAIGSRVKVQFGRQQALGYVVGMPATSAFDTLKPILGVTDPLPLIDTQMLKLVEWMAAYYCSPVELALRTVLPGAVRKSGAQFKEKLFVTPVDVDIPEGLPVKQSAVLDYVRREEGAYLVDVAKAVDVTAAPVRGLEKKGLVVIEPKKEERRPTGTRNLLPTQPLTLSDEQQVALDMVCDMMHSPKADVGSSKTVLLYGVTGSGKTEVYLQAIADVLSRGGGAIVMVPEISLTPQTTDRFISRFGDVVSILHSALSEGERHDEWHRIRSGEARIVVGVRSAVFAPVQDLQLIVVDEEHEPSYKQDETPRYHARDVAVMRGVLLNATVVLGSATPSMESWVNVQKGKYAMARLTIRADGKRMPAVQIVDMRIEAQRRQQVGVFSRALMEGIQERLNSAEQVILFLNRRGYSTSLVCSKCGFTSKCDFCSVAHTYHRTDERLRCHICGASANVPNACPECKDPAFKFSGIGTQRLEIAIKKCFPKANVARMDADAASRKGSYETVFSAFRSGKIDIMIGTQMIAKGLHFPNVTLVGVIAADLSLHMPDFRAGERTFQLITQVAGRSGRGHTPGEVIVQTYTPFNVAIQAARRVDVEGFFDQEAEFRRELRYPPYGHMVLILFRGASLAKVEYFAKALVTAYQSHADASVNVSEPCPAPLERAKGKYRFHVILRGTHTAQLTNPLRAALKTVRFPREVTYAIDVDPVGMM